MTKEELEKEADDYVVNTNTGICEVEGIETFICDSEGNLMDADSIAKSAYLAGVEPREKRIEELEKEIKRLETELAITDNDREHNYYECLDLYKKVEELNNKIDELEQRVPKWHDLRKNLKDLPKPAFKPLKVIAKVIFRGYQNPFASDEILYYDNVNWLKLEEGLGHSVYFRRLPACKKVIDWCEFPEED